MEPNNIAILDARVPGWREKTDLEIIGALCAALEGPVMLEGWLRDGKGRCLDDAFVLTDDSIRLRITKGFQSVAYGTGPTLEAAMLDAVRRARGESQ